MTKSAFTFALSLIFLQQSEHLCSSAHLASSPDSRHHKSESEKQDMQSSCGAVWARGVAAVQRHAEDRL